MAHSIAIAERRDLLISRLISIKCLCYSISPKEWIRGAMYKAKLEMMTTGVNTSFVGFYFEAAGCTQPEKVASCQFSVLRFSRNDLS